MLGFILSDRRVDCHKEKGETIHTGVFMHIKLKYHETNKQTKIFTTSTSLQTTYICKIMQITGNAMIDFIR